MDNSIVPTRISDRTVDAPGSTPCVQTPSHEQTPVPTIPLSTIPIPMSTPIKKKIPLDVLFSNYQHSWERNVRICYWSNVSQHVPEYSFP